MRYPQGLRLDLNRFLAAETALKVGGRAKIWFEPDNKEELSQGLCFCRREKLGVFVIGAGSNLLVSDCGLKGVVVALRAGEFRRIEIEADGCRVYCGAGVGLGRLLGFFSRQGLGGAEFLAGIPGTLGGALVMNAGITEGRGQKSVSPTQPSAGCPAVASCRLNRAQEHRCTRAQVHKSTGAQEHKKTDRDCFERSIGDLVRDVTVIDLRGRVKVLSAQEAGFGYRCSRLQRGIILGARLVLSAKDPLKIKREIAGYRRYRLRSQDLSYPSAGCVFKNPLVKGQEGQRRVSAGMLIDACGLKGKSIGGAMVSFRHANFILNKGRARAKDVLRLMILVKEKVRERFGVELEEELRVW